ncbi:MULTISPECIES: DinB family protein [Chitinophagaceae]
MSTQIISKEKLLMHWQGHRNLTRRVIEAFPEKALFEFSIAGMRPFSEMVKELISITVPGLEGIVFRKEEPYNHNLSLRTKDELLKVWDESTPKINELLMQIPDADFAGSFNLFGMFNHPIVENVLYFIDNEVHHRAQGYVYLRALDIVPPFFWERV